MFLLELLDLRLGRLHGRDLLHPLGGSEIAVCLGALGSLLHTADLVLRAAGVLEPLAPHLLQIGLLRAEEGELLGHRMLLEELKLSPLLDLRMRLGESSGAAVAILVLRAALACHTGMATFSEARVSNKTP